MALAVCVLGASLPTAAATLTVMQSEGPRSMDPGNHTATLTAAILDPMYEGLVRRSADGGLQPLLATRWSVSEDQTVWTFTIRKDVRFHDGGLLTPAAVIASFQRLIGPGSRLAASGRFSAIIASVERRGLNEVEFRLRRRYSDFLILLSLNQASIVSPSAIVAGNLDRVADGTGPYRFLSWRSGDSVQERRNPGYWGVKPRIDQLKWTWSSEPSVLYMALRTGDADVVIPLSPVFAKRIGSDPRLLLLRQDGQEFFWIALNTRLAPFNDRRVRQALSLATDRKALVSGLLGGFGHVALSPMSVTTPFFKASISQLRYDPAAARRLLIESGHARGLQISLVVQGSDEASAEALQQMWLKEGITLNIRRLEGGVYAAEAFAGPTEKRALDIGGVLASWSSGIVPDLQLSPLFSSAYVAPAGANLGFYADPELDGLLEAGEKTAAWADRSRLYAIAQQRIVEETPAVLLYTVDTLAGIRANVKGVSVSPGGELDVHMAERQ